MAFHQPTQQASRHHRPVPEPLETSIYAVEPNSALEESHEWVLFSPAPLSSALTQTTSIGRTHTAAISHLSDFGSLDTAAGRSGALGLAISLESEQTGDGEDAEPDEEAELDSLDSHLHDFREPSLFQRPSQDRTGPSILPVHDGLGTFQASSSAVQERLSQFEQFNSRRTRQRSNPLDALQEAVEDTADERTTRVQTWRMEQSMLLLNEIEKETRRRRLSRVSDGESRKPGLYTEQEHARRKTNVTYSGTETYKEKVVDQKKGDPVDVDSQETESFWKRITRRVIRDLIGIDDSILAVIFGESLPGEPAISLEEDDRHTAFPARLDASWEDRLLERLARELGVLVHQLSEHPGAFSTYLRTTQTPDYVGTTTPTQRSISSTTSGHLPSMTAPLTDPLLSSGLGDVIPQFPPTIPHKRLASSSDIHNASLWGVEDRPSSPALDEEAERVHLEREYWERDLDVRMVFDFLRNRFRPSSRPPPVPPATRTPSQYPSSAAARTALIRQHHPLMSSRAHKEHMRRRSSRQYHHPRVGGLVSPLTRRPSSSSCASQSEHAGGMAGPGAGGRGSRSSSRNYWDLGAGSVGSGGLVAATGGLGAWGEV